MDRSRAKNDRKQGHQENILLSTQAKTIDRQTEDKFDPYETVTGNGLKRI